MKIKQTILSLALVAGFSLSLGLYSQPVFAADPTPNKAQIENQEAKAAAGTGTCAGADTSIIKCGATNKDDIRTNGVWVLLELVLNILTAGVGILAVGGIAYGAALYASSSDKPEQAKQGMTYIKNVVIGLVAYGLMYVLLNFLIPGGIFT
jgi:hypothetical protein